MTRIPKLWPYRKGEFFFSCTEAAKSKQIREHHLAPCKRAVFVVQISIKFLKSLLRGDRKTMIINCEACQKRYLVDETVLGVSGRTLKCAACGHRWHQKATPSEQDLGNTLAVENKTLAESTPKKGWMSLSALVFVLLLVILGGGYFARFHVVSTWPQAEKFYQLIGVHASSTKASKLVLKNVRPLKVSEENAPETIVIIRGDILNPTDAVENLKSLDIAVEGDCEEASWSERSLVKLKNFIKKTDRSCVVASWHHELTETRVLPGDRMTFETEPKVLPKSARKILLDF